MKRETKKWNFIRVFASVVTLIVAVTLSGCFEEPNEMAILDDEETVVPLMHERITAQAELTYFAAMLKGAQLSAEVVDEKTDLATPVTVNFWNTLSGYGTYTLFAPNNDAVKAWLTTYLPSVDRTSPETVEAGIRALNAADMEVVTTMIQYHMVADSIPSKLFVMGKFPYPTLLGSFLLLSKEQGTYNGVERAYTVINGSAYIVTTDIKCGNGYLNILNKALEPETRTLAGIISGLDDSYSIFKSIFSDRNITDMDSLLNITYTTSKTLSGRTVKTKKKYTVFVCNDATFTRVFQDNGIVASTGIEGLKSYLNSHRQSGDDRDIDELVRVWAAYHVLDTEYYINDLKKLCGASGAVIMTMAENETLSLKNLNDIIRLNRDDARDDLGNFEVGARLIASRSDVGATNGVLHFIDKFYSMKVTRAKAVFWDLADQAVISTHPSYRNKNGSDIVGTTDDFFPDFKITAKWGSSALVTYLPAAGWDKSKTCHVYGDRITVQVGRNRIKELTITTPSLNKGQYYVWVCSRHQGSGTCNVVLSHNGNSNKRTKYFDYWGARSDTDPLNTGYKQFVTGVYQMSCHVMGQIDVTSNGPQEIKLDFDQGAANSLGAWLDMFQFIPIDDNQVWPRFDACGIAYYEQPTSFYTDPWNCPVAEAEDDDEEPLPED